jgi:hypothetical protein
MKEEERRGREERRDGQTSAKSYFFVSLCKLFYMYMQAHIRMYMHLSGS